MQTLRVTLGEAEYIIEGDTAEDVVKIYHAMNPPAAKESEVAKLVREGALASLRTYQTSGDPRVRPSHLKERPSAGGGFKAGDRIRCVREPVICYCEIGDEFVAVERKESSYGSETAVHFVDKQGQTTWRPGKYFELVKPFQIEEGKFYRRRDDVKVGPVVRRKLPNIEYELLYPWEIDGNFFTSKGFHLHNFKLDLISEWVDEWVKWDGAEKPPLPVGTAIIVRHLDGYEANAHVGSGAATRWSHAGQPGDIIAYKEIRPSANGAWIENTGTKPKITSGTKIEVILINGRSIKSKTHNFDWSLGSGWSILHWRYVA